MIEAIFTKYHTVPVRSSTCIVSLALLQQAQATCYTNACTTDITVCIVLGVVHLIEVMELLRANHHRKTDIDSKTILAKFLTSIDIVIWYGIYIVCIAWLYKCLKVFSEFTPQMQTYAISLTTHTRLILVRLILGKHTKLCTECKISAVRSIPLK